MTETFDHVIDLKRIVNKNTIPFSHRIVIIFQEKSVKEFFKIVTL